MVKNRLETRNQFFKYTILATIIWVFSIIAISVGGAMALQKAFETVGEGIKWVGTVGLILSWVVIIVFGIFNIIASLSLNNKEKWLGIICGILCLIFPLVGIIMAWVLYYR